MCVGINPSSQGSMAHHNSFEPNAVSGTKMPVELINVYPTLTNWLALLFKTFYLCVVDSGVEDL